MVNITEIVEDILNQSAVCGELFEGKNAEVEEAEADLAALKASTEEMIKSEESCRVELVTSLSSEINITITV